jgi:hypothetical protein
MDRRRFLMGTGALLMAPALVRAASLEYVPRAEKVLPIEMWWRYEAGRLFLQYAPHNPGPSWARLPTDGIVNLTESDPYGRATAQLSFWINA